MMMNWLYDYDDLHNQPKIEKHLVKVRVPKKSSLNAPGAYRTDVPQSLSSTVPLFTSPFVSQSRCSPTLYSPVPMFTGDPLHSRAACTQPCNVNTHSRAHCSPGARLCEQWGHGCVNNGARLCASARLCRGSPVMFPSPCLPPRGTPYVSQSLCCPVPLLPSPYPPVPLFHSLDIPHKWFPVPMTVCSPKIFPSPYMFPGPYALQSLCSPVPMLRSPYRLDVPRCLCSPNTVPSPYVPQYMMYME